MEEIAKKTEIANFVESNLAAIRPEIAKFLSAIFYKQIERKSVSDLNSFAAKNKELMVNQLKLLKEKEFEDFNSKIFDKFLRNQKKATNFEMEILKFKEKPHFQEKLSSLIKPMSFNECFESVAPKNNKIAHKNKFGFYQLDLIDKKKKSKEQKQKSYDKIKYFSDEWEKQSKEIILKNWLKQPTASLNDIFISKYSMSTIDGTKRLLEETDLKLVRGKKYGLVGLNGVGKTTLLKRISRYDVKGIPSATKILYVEQEIKGDDTTVLDFVLKSDVIREHLIARKTALIDKMKTENGEDLENHQNELSEIEEKMADFEIDKSLAKVGKILSGLGFSKKMEQTKTKHLSGGWRMRVSLACALFVSPDLLLLDEPTNHLDFPSVIWLENYLKKYDKTVVIVSHDRHFLDNVIDFVTHMYHKKLSYYKGDYKSFEKVYKENLMNQIKAFEAQQKQIKHIQEFIDKFRYNAKRASMVQSRIKMLRNMEKKEEVSKDKKFKMVFPAVEPLSKEIVSLTNVYFGYNKNDILLKDVDFVIQCNSRIGLMGANGVGKSTLLKLIMGFYQPLKGKVEINENAKISFFTQHHVDSLDLEKSALENITKQFEDEIPEQIDNKAEHCRKRLGRFGISQDLATRPLRHLSGGQKSRVAFCALVWNSPHLLVLDEPTNHLDMETIDALIDAVNKYEGGLLIVSHDQYFLSKVAKTFWALDNGKLQNFSSLSAIKKYVLGK